MHAKDPVLIHGSLRYKLIRKIGSKNDLYAVLIYTTTRSIYQWRVTNLPEHKVQCNVFF